MTLPLFLFKGEDYMQNILSNSMVVVAMAFAVTAIATFVFGFELLKIEKDKIPSPRRECIVIKALEK